MSSQPSTSSLPVSPEGHGEGGAAPASAADYPKQDPRYMHPDAIRLFHCCPWARKIPIFGTAATAFGPVAVGSLSLCYFLCKGIADSIITNASYPLFTDRYGIDGERYQRLSGISTMGWSIKAFTAMMCDGFAFLGYTKRWYMFISAVLGGVFAIILGVLPNKPSSADTACAFIFLCSYGKANIDILSEGYYSRLMRGIPKAGPALVSWIWWFIMLGCIIAAAIQGPLSDGNMVQVGIYISAALQIVCGPIFFFNLYGEKKNREERLEDAATLRAERAKELALLGEEEAAQELSAAPPQGRQSGVALRKTGASGEKSDKAFTDDDEAAHHSGNLDDALELTQGDEEDHVEEEDLYGFDEPIPCFFGIFEMNREVITRNWKIFVYSVIMTLAVVAMVCANILCDTLGLLIVCVIVSTVCCAFSFWALPLIIARTNVFGYMQMVCYIQLPGALYSFYLSDATCLPDGPHFSYTFYNTVSAVIGNIAGLAGVSVFNYIFAKHTYRLTVICTTFIQIIASVFDIVIVKRWNIYIGIPDHAMYICGDAVVYQVCYYLAWMPVVILLSRLCPRGSESMVYALMAGFSNLGQTTSSAIGAIIMEYGWPVNTDICDFSNVPWLVFVGHVLVPLLIIPLSWLLPSARICDNVDVDGRAIKEEVEREVLLDENNNNNSDTEGQAEEESSSHRKE